MKACHSVTGLMMIFIGLMFLMSGSCKKDKAQHEPLKNIGDLYGGGIIFDRVTYHSWINGDLESCIYSIAALSDLSSTAPWGCSGVNIPFDNNNTDGFLGRHHTIIIANNCPEQGIAYRSHCQALSEVKSCNFEQ
jgi:hypothetical protein